MIEAVVAIVVLLGGGAAVARLRKRGLAKERIDPFTLTDPWRSFVQDAQSARARFDRVLVGVEPGPLQDRLTDVERRLDDGVLACWRIAQAGHQLHKMVLEIADTGSESVTRMRGRESETRDKLAKLIRDLDESVARAAELATGQYAALDTVADDVNGVVGELEALRLALAEIAKP